MIQAGEVEVIAAVAVRWGMGIPMGGEVHKAEGCTHVDKSLLVGGLGVMEGSRIDIKVTDDDDVAHSTVLDDGFREGVPSGFALFTWDRGVGHMHMDDMEGEAMG
jgi:hypothetical protein